MKIHDVEGGSFLLSYVVVLKKHIEDTVAQITIRVQQ